MIATATAIAPVHSQPIAHSARGSTKRPITSWRIAMSMIITISGTATTPLITADQNSALIGSRPMKLMRDADQGRDRDRAVERLGVERLAVEPGGPAERLAQRIGAGAGEHRDREQADADDAGGEQGEGERAGDRPQRLGGLRRGLDVGDAVRVQGRRGG